ncbi:ATP-binding protein [Micromonospora sp. WMMD1082]|uniref:AlbA family DNA-binding domain-containing protein n=1 Tax=Micromonospora sp. WMMD1082 TaxID=3016104 RepID=UPI0024174778|nr:ATP-binding protein [Micromonospora sp. WMMD1082]MDG4796898.1 ATP-binding protein [Micromonospora sp. WMMD1082]
MPTLRNCRLEQLLGGPIDESLTYKQVTGLIPGTAEGPDLDFKRDTYGSRDKDRKALCGDVGGLANANGGLLILGMAEDSQGRATKDEGVDISDAERLRLHQTVVANVQPTPTFDIIPVEDPDRPGTGFLIIWVARTATAPHAYIQNNSLLYPRRIGTQTVWLSEALVAEAYRARFVGLTNRIEEAARLEADFASRHAADELLVVVTLVPDVPGGFTVDTAALRAFELSNASHTAGAFGNPVRRFTRSTVRHRRLVGVGTFKPSTPYSRGACELHENGGGTFSTAVGSTVSGNEDPSARLVDTQWLTLGVGAGLQFLAHHARDRAAAGGLATVRATIWPISNRPIALVSNVGWPNEQIGSDTIIEQPYADTVADIDDLCAGDRGLVATTHRLTSELFQAFGAPEVAQVTAEGAIRIRHWHRSSQAAITRWAEESGVQVLTETLG